MPSSDPDGDALEWYAGLASRPRRPGTPQAGRANAPCRERTLRRIMSAVLGVLLLGALASPVDAQVPDLPPQPGLSQAPAEDVEVPIVPDVPDVVVSVDSEDEALSRTVIIILLLTVGSVAPGLLLLMTTFTRFIIVFGLTKQAMGLQTVPPAQVLVGLALFLSIFVMNPVLSRINDDAVQPLLAGEIGQQEAVEAGFAPLRQFMLAQSRPSDVRVFVNLSGAPEPETPEEVTATTLIPAFIISELRTAFIIGFVVFVPFLVIDLVVAAVLMSMGMVMLPPVFISLPLKLLLFILVDGWVLVVGSLVNSVNAIAA